MTKTAAQVSLENRRQLGAYYTPRELSDIVCAWAVRSAEDVVLEPSFGGCVFLRAVSDALRSKGAKKPERQVYGCDVDKTAFFHLAAAFPQGFPEENFCKGDFLQLRPKHFGEQSFNAVIGNPPYVSYHKMSDAQRRAARRAIKNAVVAPQATASLWGYFVAHSLAFLAPQGRMGWILPGSLVHADYGEDLLGKLAAQFTSVTAMKVEQRYFAHVGTDESTVVLLCDGFGSNPAAQRPTVVHLKNLAEIGKFVKELGSAERTGKEPILGNAFDMEITDLHAAIQGTLGIRRFGELADVRIGVVTGANRFFLMSNERTKALKLPASALKRFLTRFYQAPGLNFTQADAEQAERGNEECLFLDTRTAEHSPDVQRYLRTFDPTKRDENETFKKGKKWHQPQMGTVSDAFLSYMHDEGPRLVLNDAGVYCTNSIHRVYFHAGATEAQRLALLISVVSTLGQFCAEVEGRSYGSGVLKIEPSEARRILVISPLASTLGELQTAVREVDALLRRGDAVKARRRADSCIFAAVPALNRRVSQNRLRELLVLLRKRRSPHLKLVARKNADAADDAS